MKNKPGDLNNHLFAQLERLAEEARRIYWPEFDRRIANG